MALCYPLYKIKYGIISGIRIKIEDAVTEKKREVLWQKY